MLKSHLHGVILAAAVIITPAICAQSQENQDPFASGESLRAYIESQNPTQPRAFFGSKQLQRDSQHVIYRIDHPVEKVFPGIILETGKIAPAMQYRGRKIPACLDREYKRHPGFWNAASGKLECNLDQVELLSFTADSSKQIVSEQMSVATEPSLDAEHKKALSSKSSGSKTPTESHNQPGEVIKRMAQGRLKQSGFSKTSANNALEPFDSLPNDPSVKKITTANQTTLEKQTIIGKQAAADRRGQVERSQPGVYVPITQAAVIPVGVTIQGKDNQDEYGVPLGTWAMIELTEPVNSADKGDAELSLLQPLVGEFQTLAQGTKLFARKRFNNGTEKMDLDIRLALTPANVELKQIRGRVYDLSKREGLSGVIKRLRKEEIKALMSKSAVSAVGAVIPQASGVIDGMATNIGEGILDQESRYLQSIPKATIQVSPQRGWIKISQGF